MNFALLRFLPSKRNPKTSYTGQVEAASNLHGMAAGLSGSLVELRLRAGEIQLSRGRTVFVTSPCGQVDPKDEDHGLWVYQTRILDKYRWLMNGKQPEFSCGSNIEQHSWIGYYVQAPKNCKQTETGECNPLQQTVELRLTRFVGEGMHEDVQLTNHTQIATSVRLQLEFEPQFVAREEINGKRKQHGRLSQRWREPGPKVWELEIEYFAEHRYAHQGNEGTAEFHRGIKLRVGHAGSPPRHAPGRITFQVKLAPHGTWHACLSWLAYVQGQMLPLSADCPEWAQNDWEQRRKEFVITTADFSFPSHQPLSCAVGATLRRSRLDLAALRLYDQEKPGEVALAAGIPTYMGVFGRDMLASAWEASLLGREVLLGSLDVIGHTQATEVNPWRDAEPGKMAHELHTDPLSVLNFRPKTLYFGGVSGSFLYPVLISDLWHWTGDRDLLRPYIDPALKALRWADTYSLDDSGFYRYQTHSEQGIKNQGWKDSSDAIVYPDGSQVPAPIGTCEMQAFIYAAKLHFSEVLWWLGEVAEAERLFGEARALKERFNEKFWMDDEGYCAMGIDNRGDLIRSIASDPGHCLLSGIVEESRAARVANRMLMDDMFSGWGVRTLSAKHPAFNPFAYHRGTVWPVENAIFVLAFARYGLHGEMHRLARALFEAASLFPHCRLPEVLGGHQRGPETPFPGLYTKADWPQAWSASAPITIVQALLGVYPYAPANVLFVDPHLPEWLPHVTLQNLRVGKAMVTLSFRRNEDGASDYSIEEIEGTLHVLRQPSPWSLTADWAERVKDAVMSLVPGH